MREGFVLVMITIALLALGGWVANIVKIFGLTGQELNAVGVELLLRVVGIVIAPLGAILGYL